MSETRGEEDLNGNTAFVVYGKLGQPLAYVIPIEEEKLTELQMSVCMEVFDAVDNAETLLKWKEVAITVLESEEDIPQSKAEYEAYVKGEVTA